jgi:hypothetical protein
MATPGMSVFGGFAQTAGNITVVENPVAIPSSRRCSQPWPAANATSRAGELLREMEEKGQRAAVSDGASSRVGRLDKPTLEDIGITKDQSSTFQKLADIPKEKSRMPWATTPVPRRNRRTDWSLTWEQMARTHTAKRKNFL